jgi:hypothetical protein
MNMIVPVLDPHGLRKFALTTAGLLAGIFGVALPWLFDAAWPLWPWMAAAVLTFWGLLHPASLRPVYRGWMKAAIVLGKGNNLILFSVVYLFILSPVGMLMRWLGYDPLQRRYGTHARSYRKPAPPRLPDHMEKPY